MFIYIKKSSFLDIDFDANNKDYIMITIKKLTDPIH
jgi:hypothetical protein